MVYKNKIPTGGWPILQRRGSFLKIVSLYCAGCTKRNKIMLLQGLLLIMLPASASCVTSGIITVLSPAAYNSYWANEVDISSYSSIFFSLFFELITVKSYNNHLSRTKSMIFSISDMAQFTLYLSFCEQKAWTSVVSVVTLGILPNSLQEAELGMPNRSLSSRFLSIQSLYIWSKGLIEDWLISGYYQS